MPLLLIIVFEGRDAAGKGGTIKAITERVSPRVFRIAALPAPSDREKSQMYIQRYMTHFPAAGEIVIFDRSWYNRAGVEHVMRFCTEEQHGTFLRIVPFVEQTMLDSGIILVKYWLEVSKEEQARRFEARIEDPLRQWKRARWILSPGSDGMTTRELVTRCFLRRIRPNPRGTLFVPRIRKRRGSTALRIF